MHINRVPALKRADALIRLGRMDCAIAEYQRLLDVEPGDEETANRLAAVCTHEGSTEAAAAYFTDLAERLLQQTRLPAAEALYRRVLLLDPADAHALTRCGEIAAAQRRLTEAHRYFAAAADLRVAQGDIAAAGDLRARIDRLDLVEIQEQLDLARLRAGGSGAFDVLHDGRPAKAEPPDLRVKARIARAFVHRGDAVGAAAHLTAEMAGGDVQLLFAIAEIQLRGGKHDEAIALIEQAAASEPALLVDAARLGAVVGPGAPAVGFRLVEMAVNRWTAQAQWGAAVDALDEFTLAVPDHVPALVWMLDLATTAGLDAPASRALARLEEPPLRILTFPPRAAS